MFVSLCFYCQQDVVRVMYMTERLEYGLNETGLQISTSKQIVHAVTARRGAMLDELRRPVDRQVHQRLSRSDGMIVKFDFRELGKSMVVGRNTSNAQRVFELVQQFEEVAAIEGWQDPRIQASLSGGHQSRYLIDVERPRGADDEVEQKISAAMLRYARLLRWNFPSADDRRDIRVVYDTQEGASIITRHASGPTLSTKGTGYSPTAERIRLEGVQQSHIMNRDEKFARLICFTGIVATLHRLDSPDSLAV